MTGSAGSGKTTLSVAIADSFGAVRLGIDAARLAVYGSTENSDGILRSDPDRFYGDTKSAVLYCARQILASGASVIIDGNMATRQERDSIRRMAHEANALPILIRIRADSNIARTRLLQRKETEDSRKFNSTQIPIITEYARKREQVIDQDEKVLDLDGEDALKVQLDKLSHYLQQAESAAA